MPTLSIRKRPWLSRLRWRATFVSLLVLASMASMAAAQEGGRVEIPLAAYQELLGGHSSSTDAPGHAFSNVTVSVRAVEADGRVSAEVTVSARVRTFGEGWTLVPLAANGPVSNAQVGGNAAELIERGGIVAWPVEGEGTHQLQWTYSVDASRHGSGWVLGLANPGTGGRLDATFSGMTIAPVVMPASSVSVSAAGSDTRLSATLGAGSGVQLSWQADATGGFTLSRARYRAEPVGGTDAQGSEAMRFTAELVVEVDGDGRAMIPLFPSNVALESVMIGRTEAPIAVQDDRFVVPIRGRGRHRISASFLVPIQREEGLPRVEVDVARTPVSRFELTLPGDREVSVSPRAGVETTRRNGKTVASFNVPMTEHVQIEWSEAVPVDAVEVETRAHADIVHVVRPDEGVLGLRAFVKYEISRGSLRRADIDVPRDVQINSVESRNADVVSDWRVEGNVLTVFLDREIEGSLELDVKYERAWPVATRTTNAFEVPMLRARDVHRQRGMVALLAVRELTLEPGESAHVSRVGDNQLPADVRDELDATVAHTFRYLDEAPQLTATGAIREPEAARFDAQVDTLVSLGDVSTNVATRIELEVKSGSLTELNLRMPEGLSLLEVSAPSLRRYVLSDDGRTLTIELTQPMEGRFTVELLCDRVTGQEEELQIPLLGVEGAEVERGRVGVEALAPFQVDMASAEHLSPIDASELPEPLLLRTDNPILHAYRYAQASEPPRFAVRITRHEEIQTRNATVESARYQTLYTRDGVAVTTARFVVQNRRQQFLRVQLPEGSEVWSASVDGRTQTPALETGSDADEPIVLLNIVSAAEGFDVELVYATEVSALGSVGRLSATLPELDIVVTRTEWELILPDGVSYAEPSTTLAIVQSGGYVSYDEVMSPLAEAGVTMPTGGRRYVFQKMYGTDSAASVSIPYVAGWWGVLAKTGVGLGALLFWLGLMAMAMIRFGWGLPKALQTRIKLASYRDVETGVVLPRRERLKRWGGLIGMTSVGLVLLVVTLGYLGLEGGPALLVTVALFGMLGALFLKEKIDAMPKKAKLAPAGPAGMTPAGMAPAADAGESTTAAPVLIEAKEPPSDDE